VLATTTAIQGCPRGPSQGLHPSSRCRVPRGLRIVPAAPVLRKSVLVMMRSLRRERVRSVSAISKIVRGISLPATTSDGRLINCFYARIRSGRWRLAASDYGDAQQNEDGAFMEPRRCNRWQSVAASGAPERAKQARNRCRGLRLVANRGAWSGSCRSDLPLAKEAVTFLAPAKRGRLPRTQGPARLFATLATPGGRRIVLGAL
jgi:hypothetical protein